MLTSGRMVLGCNYWASHAGTRMWTEWRPEVVEADFRQMAELGMTLIRVFPAWRDFQPLTALYGPGNSFCEYRLGEAPLPDTPAGRAGVDETMMARFRFLADTASRYDLKLSVGILTGWMSGRVLAPPAFDGRELLRDPECLKWEVRFVRYFVETFKTHPAVAMWGPGNECNCLGEVSRAEFWRWNYAIVRAIREADPTRPIAAGMHGLTPGEYAGSAGGGLQDIGGMYDFLTVHPYPLFTPHAALDERGGFRANFQAAAESCFYRDLGGRFCFAEEFGDFGEMWCDDDTAAGHLRGSIWNLWSHDGGGLLWWCAYSFTHLRQAPYDWVAMERDLGLVDAERNVKPFAREFRRWRERFDALPFDRLPEQSKRACCILTGGQDQWGNAWGAFLLARQAGFALRFAYFGDPLPEAELYLLPGPASPQAIVCHRYEALLDKVRAGASLYVSLDAEAALPRLREVFGLEIVNRRCPDRPLQLQLDGMTLPLESTFRHTIRPLAAEVALAAADGGGMLFRHRYGAGEVFLFDAPLEKALISAPGRLERPDELPYYRIYRTVAAAIVADNPVTSDQPLCSITEHYFTPDEAVVIVVNNSRQPRRCRLRWKDGWQITGIAGWPAPDAEQNLRLPADDGTVLRLKRRKGS